MTMKRITTTAAAALLAIPLLAGCQQPGQTTAVGTGVGAVAGGVAGGLLGRAVGGGTGGVIAGTLLGAVAGGLLGNAIASRLEPQDQRVAYAATEQTLAKPVGARTNWRSPTNGNISGYSQVISAQGNCRVVRNSVNISGSQDFEDRRFCRDVNGAWQPA
jgi:surface antigen